ncbi:MAG: DUF2480 family protein [Rubricoccaceae bacterium]
MEIVNRVAESDLVVYDLAALWDGRPVVELDLAPWLHRGLVLRERDFRAHLAAHDWSIYDGQHVAVYCSADAIVPVWAFMLVATRLSGAASVAQGRAADLRRDHFARALAAEDWSRFADRPVVVKGCGNDVVPLAAYLDATRRLQAVASKLMFGEPCSSVPLWRRPKAAPAESAPAARPAARPASLRPRA